MAIDSRRTRGEVVADAEHELQHVGCGGVSHHIVNRHVSGVIHCLHAAEHIRTNGANCKAELPGYR
jgi:hypothetical protein